MIKTYSDMSRLKTFEQRYNYLKLDSKVGQETFGFDRYLNQLFYRSVKWRKIRDQVIIRDNGCDLGIEGHDIYGKIIIHHMNPICLADIKNESEMLLNPEYLIATTQRTHNAIHYGNDYLSLLRPIIREPNDTSPWKMERGI